MNTAVLLVNLGSPDSPTVPDVRRYLREFLSDPYVLDGSWLLRQIVLNFFILPFRPKNSAHAYQTIWTKDGSPLIVISKRVQILLQQRVDLPVFLAMRYGQPSIPHTIQQMIEQGIEEILLIPLYPHYAMSSYETVVARVKKVLRPSVRLKVLAPFYDDEAYIRALIANTQEDLQNGYDHLLFSFHGLPERHLKLADTSKSHCLIQPECCSKPHPVHKACYRAQAFKTVQRFVNQAAIPKEKYSISFQSRLGRDPWLKPYTDFEIQALAQQGIKKLLVICPAFVADCLETLEEIAIRGKELFVEAGGKDLKLVPCLNDHPLWIEALEGFVAKLRQN